MDAEAVIAAVYKHKVLWDTSDKNFKDRRACSIAWEKVCNEINNHDYAAVKKKWKNLKDYYRSELIKLARHKSGESGSSKKISRWPYLEQMAFIKTTLCNKPRMCSLQRENYNESDEEDETEIGNLFIIKNENQNDETSLDADTSNFENQPGPSNTTPNYTPSDSNSFKMVGNYKRSHQEAFIESYVDLESRKKALLEMNMEEDDDLLFFKSLLPDIRILPRAEKLLLRIKIQELVYKSVVQNST